MAKIAFYWLGLSIFEKMLTYCSTSERQNFSGDPIIGSSIQKMHFRGSLYASFEGVQKLKSNSLDLYTKYVVVQE